MKIMVSNFPYQAASYLPSSAGGDQMIYMTNRSRTESGSSEGSRGSGESNGSGKSRRRSHRPRGCRGGSNRRRHNNNICEGRKKAHFKPINNDFQGRNHNSNKFSYLTTTKKTSNNASESEFLVQNRTGQNNFHRGFLNTVKDLSFDLPDYPPCHNKSQYFDNHFLYHPSELCLDYPPLQTSFSESSNELMTEQHDTSVEKNSFVGQSGSGSILPPLPSNAFHNTKPIPTGPNPYALKLSVSASAAFIPSNGNHSSSIGGVLPRTTLPPPPPQTNSSAPANSHPPGILQPLNLTYGNNLFNQLAGNDPVPVKLLEKPSESGEVDADFSNFSSSIYTTMMDQHSNDSAKFYEVGSYHLTNNQDFEYLAERLEKQRQNVEGGSLFVTSPRSFLMGLKKSFHCASVETSPFE